MTRHIQLPLRPGGAGLLLAWICIGCLTTRHPQQSPRSNVIRQYGALIPMILLQNLTVNFVSYPVLCLCQFAPRTPASRGASAQRDSFYYSQLCEVFGERQPQSKCRGRGKSSQGGWLILQADVFSLTVSKIRSARASRGTLNHRPYLAVS